MINSVDEKEFVEATILVHPNQADAVTNYVTENIVDGVEFEETSNANLISIKFYVPATSADFRSALMEYLSQIAAGADLAPPKYSERAIKSEDWEESYKRSFAPEFIGDNIVVRPPWSEISTAVKYDIIIEPKMAFGTGHHETTRACLKMIHEYFESTQRLLDFGCGSGVLAILAGKMGASYLKAVDNDPIAIENTFENFEINKINCRHDIQLGSLDMTTGDTAYNMVCANLQKSDLLANFGDLTKLTSDNGLLLLSGLLESDQSEIETIIKDAKLEIVEFIHEGEWLTYLVKR